MTSAIARWHSSARPPSDALELAYADRLEAEMQELAIQLHKVTGQGAAESISWTGDSFRAGGGAQEGRRMRHTLGLGQG